MTGKPTHKPDPNPEPAKPPRRAVAYLRMSTERQEYSPQNQIAAIKHYAAEHDMEIVATYSDEARSGLRLENRPGMRQMLDDAKREESGFDTILVYDITRWGRFQNPDQSASIEYACQKAKVEVHYCMEQFVNDGSPVSNIIKAVKRSMAAEQARELSNKVFAGQCTLIQRGFRQGGMAGYGLRRMRIDQNGEPQGILDRGQRKSLQTDRVILVPGPDEEVKNVRWMYRQFIDGGRLEGEIAALLNERGIRTNLDRTWTRGTVHQVLTNEKYIGNNVFNRHSYKLKETHKNNPPEEWIRADGAFEAIVDPRLFFTAQGMIRERNRRFSDDEMIGRLERLLKKKGLPLRHRHRRGRRHAVERLLRLALRQPGARLFAGRIHPRPGTVAIIEINRALRRIHAREVARAIDEIEQLGGAVSQDQATDLLTVNGEFTTSIVVARCRHTKAGSRRWKVRLDTGLAPDLTVALRMDDANEAILDYYLLPLSILDTNRLGLAEENGLMLDALRFDTLDRFFAMAERAPITEIAL